MVDTNRVQVTRMGGGDIPDRWAGELESVVRRPDGALRVTMRTIGEGMVTVIDFDADDVGWIVATAQPEPQKVIAPIESLSVATAVGDIMVRLAALTDKVDGHHRTFDEAFDRIDDLEAEVRNTKAPDDKWKEQVTSLTDSLVEADKELRRRVIVLESRVRGLEDPGDTSSLPHTLIESQRRRLAEPGPWEPAFEGAAESAAARIPDDAVSSVDDAPKPVEFVGALELYRKALQDIADGARDPVSVAWKVLHDASWAAFSEKANEPLRANVVTVAS